MAKIVIVQFSHLTVSLNGADMYHHNLAKVLHNEGHEVRFVSHAVTNEGIFEEFHFYPASRLQEWHEWADIVITTPGKVRTQIKGKDYIFIQHNINKEPFPVDFGRVIYCAQHVADKINYLCLVSAVLWPFNRYVDTTPLPSNESGKITLVNCNRNKGGDMLVRLSQVMPDKQFLGITSGYGHQIRKYRVPNLEYRDGSYELKDVLKDTSIVIMPSGTEGLPTLALECASLGVPLLMSDIPAARELNAWRCEPRYFVNQINAMDYESRRADTFILADKYKAVHLDQIDKVVKWFR